jgi:4-hydroxybenzoate polyprenyltransferase
VIVPGVLATMTAPQQTSSLRFLVQVSRPGLWATSAWFYLLPLGRRPVFHAAGFWLGLLYVTFPLGFILYGWNDLVDQETDRVNPRKGTFLFGARGTREQLASIPLRIALLQAVFLAAFWYLDGPRMVLWFAGLIAFTALYNWPRYGLKSRPPFEVLNQAGFLLVFVLSSWLNHAPQLRWSAMLFGAMFAMHSHVFGEIMDIEPDRLSGRPTTATVVGPVAAKIVIMLFLAGEAGLVYAGFKDAWMAAFLLFGAVWFLLDATCLWRTRPYSTGQMRAFLLGWNLIALASMRWVWSTASLTH